MQPPRDLQEPEALAHVGTCAIVGLPNVGKSTLMNRVMGLRMMAVSPKPQTTRNRVLGVVNRGEGGSRSQIVFVDTPGVQGGKGPFRRFMRDEALGATDETDIACVVVDVVKPEQKSWEALMQSEARLLLDSLADFSGPVLLALNKVDKLGVKEALFPILDSYAAANRFAELVPISAKSGSGVEVLVEQIARRLSSGAAMFPEDMYTDRAERFLAAELVREQLFRQLGEELPYASAVVVESFQERSQGDIMIEAVIHVERESQKGMVIGKGGRRIKAVGERARAAIGQLFGVPVHLKLLVKVSPDWSRDEQALHQLGYES